jgi:hypothetical protein
MMLLRNTTLGIGVLSVHLAVLFNPSVILPTDFEPNKYLTSHINSVQRVSFIMREAKDISDMPLAALAPKPAFDNRLLKKNALPYEAQGIPKIQVVSELDIRVVQQEKAHLDDYVVAEFFEEVASPNQDFSEILHRLLPVEFQPFLLEFWIDQDGNTSRVICIDGGCTDEVSATLVRLQEITFRPALKDGSKVASRKLIQVEPIVLL